MHQRSIRVNADRLMTQEGVFQVNRVTGGKHQVRLCCFVVWANRWVQWAVAMPRHAQLITGETVYSGHVGLGFGEEKEEDIWGFALNMSEWTKHCAITFTDREIVGSIRVHIRYLSWLLVSSVSLKRTKMVCLVVYSCMSFFAREFYLTDLGRLRCKNGRTWVKTHAEPYKTNKPTMLQVWR